MHGSCLIQREWGRLDVIKSRVCSQGLDSSSVTFGESQLEHRNSDESRKKCHAALLGVLVPPPTHIPPREYTSGGSALSQEPALVCWVSLPNVSSDVDSCQSVWVPTDSESILGGLNTYFRKCRGESEHLVFVPCGLAVFFQDAGSTDSGTRARHPSLQSIIN